jgi:hypothetical protein
VFNAFRDLLLLHDTLDQVEAITTLQHYTCVTWQNQSSFTRRDSRNITYIKCSFNNSSLTRHKLMLGQTLPYTDIQPANNSCSLSEDSDSAFCLKPQGNFLYTRNSFQPQGRSFSSADFCTVSHVLSAKNHYIIISKLLYEARI